MPSTRLPDPRRTPRFGGLVTFGRYPRLEDVARADRPVDWIIYGVPYDGGVTYRPGARFGPRAIRAESQYLKRYSIEHDVDVPGALSIADAGDAAVSPYSCERNARTVREFAAALDGGAGAAQTRLLALGGDHSIAYANLHATWVRQRKPRGGLALVHFDSHLDTVDAVWDERWGHASVFRRAIEDGVVNPRRMLSMGIKGPINARADLDYAAKAGIKVLTCEQWRTRGEADTRSFVRSLRGSPVYVTFDIDCIDPAFAPGTGTPSIGGLTSAEALRAIRALAGANIAGADVVEVLPDRDPQGITSLLAAHIAFEILAIDAARREVRSRPKRAARRG